MKKLILATLIAMVSLPVYSASWGGWGEDISSNSKSRNEALRMAQVIPAKVIDIRQVTVAPSNSRRAIGSAVGTLGGVAIANQMGNSDVTRIVAGVAGGLLAQGVTPGEIAHEVMVLYHSPSQKAERVIAITTKESFSKGDSVYLIQDANGVRIAKY